MLSPSLTFSFKSINYSSTIDFSPQKRCHGGYKRYSNQFVQCNAEEDVRQLAGFLLPHRLFLTNQAVRPHLFLPSSHRPVLHILKKYGEVMLMCTQVLSFRFLSFPFSFLSFLPSFIPPSPSFFTSFPNLSFFSLSLPSSSPFFP